MLRNGTIHLALTPEIERSLRTDQTDTVFIALLNADRQVFAGTTRLGHLGITPVAFPRPGQGLRSSNRPSTGIACAWQSFVACGGLQPPDPRGRNHHQARAHRTTGPAFSSGFFVLLVLIG